MELAGHVHPAPETQVKRADSVAGDSLAQGPADSASVGRARSDPRRVPTYLGPGPAARRSAGVVRGERDQAARLAGHRREGQRDLADRDRHADAWGVREPALDLARRAAPGRPARRDALAGRDGVARLRPGGGLSLRAPGSRDGYPETARRRRVDPHQYSREAA